MPVQKNEILFDPPPEIGQRGVRINIYSFARKIQSALWASKNLDFFNSHNERPLSGVIDWEAIEQDRPELYSLVAVLTHELFSFSKIMEMNLSVNKLREFGMNNVPAFSSGFQSEFNAKETLPYFGLQKYAYLTLAFDTNLFLEEVMAGTFGSGLRQVLKRTRVLLVERSRSSNSNKNDVESFLMSGVGTAFHTMSKALFLISQIYDVNVSEEQYRRTAESCYKSIVSLAMGNLDVVVGRDGVFSRLCENGSQDYVFDRDKFQISNGRIFKHDWLEIDIKEPLKSELKSLPDYSLTPGCPAMVNFGNESVVEKLWKWETDIGWKICQSRK